MILVSESDRHGDTGNPISLSLSAALRLEELVTVLACDPLHCQWHVTVGRRRAVTLGYYLYYRALPSLLVTPARGRSPGPLRRP